MNFPDSPIVTNFLNGELPTVEVSVTVPGQTLIEMALAALVVGALLAILIQSL